jgi:hypothetical protein
LDEVAAETLDMPDLPGPGLTLLDLDAALNVPNVLPLGTELARLDPGSYKLRLPGGDACERVTTEAKVFDDHPERHEFLSPGGIRPPWPALELRGGPWGDRQGRKSEVGRRPVRGLAGGEAR